MPEINIPDYRSLLIGLLGIYIRGPETRNSASPGPFRFSWTVLICVKYIFIGPKITLSAFCT